MNCTSARDVFPALLDPRTAATAHLEARAHLAHCPDCQRDFASLTQAATALDELPIPAPSPRLRRNFYAMLEEEKNSAASVRAAARREHRASLWRWILAPAGACALALAAFLAGTRYAPTAPATDPATARQIADLKKQVSDVKQLVGYSILQQQQNPTSERLREVLAAAQSDQPAPKDLAALVDALAFDPSTNIRLRALEALVPHASQELVRTGVLAALPREQNPLVQLEMIEFVAASQNREATPVLEKISQNEQIDRTVRAAAQRALTQL